MFDIDEDEKDGSVLYHVMYMYEDNDSEDMSEEESRLYIDLFPRGIYRQLEDEEINEWEICIGGDE